ncbi:uncharacterized protein LOC117694165 [Arvicanthis niloticus]|uniref:uncharacterized protein LOC117694165 n=1 Tax=Arvicanthis niloticus TaxID=61156 RepID=UPI001486C846|nr:enhanced filamentous growth protein 1-like [Arvicanthis niloticus]
MEKKKTSLRLSTGAKSKEFVRTRIHEELRAMAPALALAPAPASAPALTAAPPPPPPPAASASAPAPAPVRGSSCNSGSSSGSSCNSGSSSSFSSLWLQKIHLPLKAPQDRDDYLASS